MSQFQGTSGQWNIEENVNHYPFITTEEGQLIAVLIDKDGGLFYGRTLEETIANAKLISAAPDLLKSMTDHEDPNLFKINWLGILIRACERPDVYNALVKDNDKDNDSINIMLNELKDFVKTGNEAIQKAITL